MLIFLNVAIIATLALARPEPPVNSYLPPSAAGNDGNISFLTSSGVYKDLNIEGSRNGGGINSPSRNYGVSDFGRSSFNNGDNRPASTYGAPFSGSGNNDARGNAGGLASTYGAPSNSNGANRQSPSSFRGDKPSSAYGTPSFDKSNGSGGTTSSTYRAFGEPIGSGGRTSSLYVAGRDELSSFSDSGNGSGRELSSIYGAPGFSGNNKRFGEPSSTYDASRSISRDRGGNNIQSATYGAPGVGGNRPVDSYEAPASGTTGYSRGNGEEGRRGTFGDKRNGFIGTENNREPAKYEFSYQVEDPPSSLSFGHSEKRDGDYTTGQYNVLLPNGREQIVEYEADKNGYRPQIRYKGDNYAQRFGSTGGYSYDQSEGNGGESSGFTIGQDFGTNGYSNGRPNDGRNGSNRIPSDQNLGSNSYSNGTPKSFGGNGGGNGNQYNNGGQGYSSGHPNNNNDKGDGEGYHNGGYQSGGGGGNGNGYDYRRQDNFGSNRSNGDNNASGYRY